MPHVRVNGLQNTLSFPDEMSSDDILAVLRQKFAQQAVEGTQPIDLQPIQASARASNPSLVQRIGSGIAGALTDSGIISDNFRAQEIGRNVSAIGEFLPGVGDATAGDEFGRAAAEGDAAGLGFAALGAIPLIGDAAKKLPSAEKLKSWYHGTNNYFDEFESSFLGSSNPAKDSKLGFYFSKSEDTANAYRDVTPSIKPSKFKETYGRTIEEQKERIDKASVRFKDVFGIDFDEFKSLSHRERGLLEAETPNLKQGVKQITDAKSTLNPYTYESYPYSMDEWIDEEKGGRLIEANIPDSELMEFDYNGQPWDENKQHAIAKEAQEKGFKGVLFKDMQDSGWFGGQGSDDVALIFNPSDIKQIRPPTTTTDAAKGVGKALRPEGRVMASSDGAERFIETSDKKVFKIHPRSGEWVDITGTPGEANARAFEIKSGKPKPEPIAAQTIDEVDTVAGDTDYRITHTAPTRDGANTLDDMSDAYPDDVYNSSVAGRFYGHGGESKAMDAETARIIAGFKGKPEKEITIYRAVPKGVKEINKGDWITVNKNYANSHGDSWVDDGNFDVISKKVKAKDIATDANSIHEFGYDP